MGKLKEGFAKAKSAVSESIFGPKLEKAKIFLMDEDLTVTGGPIVVQFNPSEYHLSRGMRTKEHPGIGKDEEQKNVRPVAGGKTNFSVALYFDLEKDYDTISLNTLRYSLTGPAIGAYPGKAGTLSRMGAPDANKDPEMVISNIMALTKFEPNAHNPERVEFIWGTLDFIGVVENCGAEYTMFKPNGNPLRVKIDLTIAGEEAQIINGIKQLPFSSPNRTKERTLLEGDQLWMLADREYNDPAMWKVIAESNDVLNPRKLGSTKNYIVPSIK
ncbi:MAG TPA: hypothetical protein PLU75_05795 [Oscillospiraceae bacterium]|nr:hypothetical protein [Oscillospiraceae bacterium]HRW57198.1 hypothetical protein [Oscillospiraceae bacterium]